MLANTLERFNRKERNLLIRDILGALDTPLPLSPDFRHRLAKATGLPLSLFEAAWWATDYHFDWLAGALLTFMTGETMDAQANDPDLLIAGNQEDVDLVVAVSDPPTNTHHLILVEVKAHTNFTTKQFKSKLARIERLYAFYERLERASSERVQFHFLICSPRKPTKLSLRGLPWASIIEHIPLKLRKPEPHVLAVSRCNEDAAPSAAGKLWRCVSVPDIASEWQ